MKLPKFHTPAGTLCPECGDPCKIVGLDNAFDYPDQSAKGSSIHRPAGWGLPVSDCCEGEFEEATTEEEYWGEDAR